MKRSRRLKKKLAKDSSSLSSNTRGGLKLCKYSTKRETLIASEDLLIQRQLPKSLETICWKSVVESYTTMLCAWSVTLRRLREELR